MSIQLAIAKAKISAEFSKNGGKKDSADDLLQSIDLAARECSPRHVQACKRAILSAAPFVRPAGIMGYIESLASESPSRMARNLLYIVHDWVSQVPQVALDVAPHLFTIFHAARQEKAACHGLLDLWLDRKLFSKELIAALRSLREPLKLPPLHGEPGKPYDQLPAANMLRYIKGDYAPIAPEEMQPEKLPKNPPAALLTAVDALYARLEKGWQFPEHDGEDEITYKGWSRKFLARWEQKHNPTGLLPSCVGQSNEST